MQNIFVDATGNLNVPVVVFVVAAVLALAMAVVIYCKNRSIEEIRSDAYQLFLKAERLFTDSGAGEEKMDWVCEKAYALLPTPIQLIVTPSMIRVILQKWFDQIKDLLDDGKKNDSINGEDVDVNE